MNVLFIFDDSLDTKKYISSFFKKGDMAYLFPLTSKSSLIDVVAEGIRGAGCAISIIISAKAVNISADALRDKYIQFVGELPDQIAHRGKNLKEFFAVDAYATLWWFSLIAEKNVYKSDAFNRFAQSAAIIDFIKNNKIEKIIFWNKSKKLREVLSCYASEQALCFISLPRSIRDSMAAYISKFQAAYYLSHIILLLGFVKNLYIRAWRIKREVGKIRHVLSAASDTVLIITSYPNIDAALAQKGVFKNKFFPSLAEALEAEGHTVVWGAFYVENRSISFRESLRYAKQCIQNGTVILFLEQFILLGTQIRLFLRMLVSGLRYCMIENEVSRQHTFGNYNFYSIFRDDWYSSFAGVAGYSGLLYYNIFSRMFNQFKIKSCIYGFEMHAWEKALISARELTGNPVMLYGYQSSAVSRMLLNFFNTPQEIQRGGVYLLPRPDKIICNGKLVYQYMKESGWSEQILSIGEAIRYNHLKKLLGNRWDKAKNKILIALSISPQESASILNIAYEVLKNSKDKEVWLKPHPFLDIKRVFELSGIPEKDFSFKIKTEPLERLLTEVRAVIVGESTVAVEALAFGCEVIIVNVPEWINMSPLRSAKNEMIKTVYSTAELQQVVTEICNEEYTPEFSRQESRRILNEYFYFNEGLDTPSRFLKILNEA